MITAAVRYGLAGGDPLTYLTEADPLRLAVMDAIAIRGMTERKNERRDQAVLIRNEIAEMLK